MPAQFDALEDRLLRAGVAPRHVSRYLRELAEHLEDLVADELRAGRDPQASEIAAMHRLGDVDSLAQPMIARKEFQSWSYRAPALVYLLAPFGEWIGIGLSVLVPFGLTMKLAGTPQSQGPVVVPDWFDPLFTLISGLALYLAPLALGWNIADLARRQRMKPFWPIVGLVFVAVLCGLTSFNIRWCAVPNGVCGMSANLPLFFSPFPQVTSAMVVRVLVNLGFNLTAYRLWHALRFHLTSSPCSA